VAVRRSAIAASGGVAAIASRATPSTSSTGASTAIGSTCESPPREKVTGEP
jgi:hypothetical protein